ncbi:MAG: prepilin peptidase [Tetrasphaera sp.]|jgi:leader peptidase (prepilin peptidase)/N-methyltransferase|nr:prepilin peptidase [Tetrasphaera sp.]
MRPQAAVVLACIMVFGALGFVTARELATGGYRIAEDQPRHERRSTWWVPVVMAGLAGYVAWMIGDLAHWAALPAYLLFTWLSVTLAWIDLDVHRLPYGLVAPALPAMVALLALASLAAGGRHWLTALLGGLLHGGVFLLLGVLPGGGVGGGDRRLAPIIGLTLGWLGLPYAVLGLVFGFFIGGVGAGILLIFGRVERRDPIAFGPAMCAGAFLAVGLTSRIVGLLTTG